MAKIMVNLQNPLLKFMGREKEFRYIVWYRSAKWFGGIYWMKYRKNTEPVLSLLFRPRHKFECPESAKVPPRWFHVGISWLVCEYPDSDVVWLAECEHLEEMVFDEFGRHSSLRLIGHLCSHPLHDKVSSVEAKLDAKKIKNFTNALERV
jgi:hypothetical protein